MLLAAQLVEAVQGGLARRGFRDVRPAHRFAFVRISQGDATIADVAEHLGVSKQAVAQLVQQLDLQGQTEEAGALYAETFAPPPESRGLWPRCGLT